VALCRPLLSWVRGGSREVLDYPVRDGWTVDLRAGGGFVVAWWRARRGRRAQIDRSSNGSGIHEREQADGRPERLLARQQVMLVRVKEATAHAIVAVEGGRSSAVVERRTPWPR
jgi:hypothetical protein